MSTYTYMDAPAFPRAATYSPLGSGIIEAQDGLTAREHAAIALRVPESGNEWLDKMIRTAQRNDLAAKFAAALVANPTRASYPDEIAGRAKLYADAMLSGAQIAEGEWMALETQVDVDAEEERKLFLAAWYGSTEYAGQWPDHFAHAFTGWTAARRTPIAEGGMKRPYMLVAAVLGVAIALWNRNATEAAWAYLAGWYACFADAARPSPPREKHP